MIQMILAISNNGVIGDNNELPWRIPSDLKWFKETTMGKPIIMGRKTWESIGRPLPGRPNVVLTSRPINDDRITCLSSIDAILEYAKDKTVMVIGGAQLYRVMLPHADRLYVSRVQVDTQGDTTLPEMINLDPAVWETKTIDFIMNPDDDFPYAIEEINRIK